MLAVDLYWRSVLCEDCCGVVVGKGEGEEEQRYLISFLTGGGGFNGTGCGEAQQRRVELGRCCMQRYAYE